MIYLSTLLLLFSYWLLGRKAAIQGWFWSAVANLIWLGVSAYRHQLDFAITGLVFTVMALFNLYKALQNQRLEKANESRNS